MSVSAADSPALRATKFEGMRLPRRVFVGAIVSPKSLLSLRVYKRGIIGVGSGGAIRFVDDLDEVEREIAATSTGTQAGGDEEDDRCATPVPIPGNQSVSNHHDKPQNTVGQQDKDEGLTMLPPPAFEPHEPSGISVQLQGEEAAIRHVVEKHGWAYGAYELVKLDSGSFLSPGFVDTHIHACQVPNLGLGQQYELLGWLENITFPRERKFEDPVYARKTYETVVERMLNCGTTTAAMYATIHEEGTAILAEVCNEKGIRALVGKCQADRNCPVDYVEKNASVSMEGTKKFINYCRSLLPYGQPLDPLSPSITPSDASASPEMDHSIARLSKTMREIEDATTSSGTSQESQASTSTSATSVETSSPKMDKKVLSQSGAGSSKSRSSSLEATQQAHRTGSVSSTSSRGSRSGLDKKQREKENAAALVQPILTPRFALACSEALLTSIGAMVSRDPSLRIQTHLSENDGEIEFTKKLFAFASCYTDVYDHFSLLTPRTILAHCIHLDDYEMGLIRKRKCGISHCPNSNFNLRSGAARVGEMLNMGIKVGLGTDMSGGFGMSILSAIRDASFASKTIAFTAAEHGKVKIVGKAEEEFEETVKAPTKRVVEGEVGANGVDKVSDQSLNGNSTASIEHSFDFTKSPLSLATLFYMATLGGAEVCSLAHRTGSLDVGKEFDALLINTDASCANPNMYVEENDTLEARFEKMLFCGDDRNIASVFVRGRVVGGSAPIL